MPVSLKRDVRVAVVAGLALAVGLAGGWALRGGGMAATAAMAQESAVAEAEAQLKRFYESLSGRAALADVLGDAFQLVRTDGTRFDRDGYLARPAAYTDYRLSGLVAKESGDVLTVSYFAGVTGKVGDTGIASSAEPRLAVFAKTGDAWQLQALANLGNGLAANPAAAGRTAVEAWVGAVASGDTARVAKVVAPEFQIIRADGSAYDAAAYVQSDLPVFPEAPQIGGLVVTGFGDYLVARYEVTTKVTLGAETELRGGPRLTVFRKSGDTWLVVAHANLAAIVR